jgi:hypothetical protein
MIQRLVFLGQYVNILYHTLGGVNAFSHVTLLHGKKVVLVFSWRK